MRWLIIAIILVSLAFLIYGCGEAPECTVPADCGASTACITKTCSVEGKCISTSKPNCCGNNRCEEKAGENSCGCPEDCKPACDSIGKISFNITTNRGPRATKAQYAVYGCNEQDKCVITVSPDDVTQLKLTNKMQLQSVYNVDILNTLNHPFVLGVDELTIRLTLRDINPERISGGMSITGIKVLNGNYLMAEKAVNKQLVNVGDEIVEKLSLTSAQTEVEQSLLPSVEISFNYIPMNVRGDILPLLRTTNKYSISNTRLTFIQP